jgi:hypothetical protein
MTEPIKKKRGRKPKVLAISKFEIHEDVKQVNSEDEKVILHLPITMNDINNHQNDILDDTQHSFGADRDDLDIFIKPNDNIPSFVESSDSNDIFKIEKSIALSSTDMYTMSMKTPNKIQS